MKGKGCSAYCATFIHNTKNKYNKQNRFNLAPSTNYKHSAVSDHARASGHTSPLICELERRNSSLANQYKVAHAVADKVTYNALIGLEKKKWPTRNFSP